MIVVWENCVTHLVIGLPTGVPQWYSEPRIWASVAVRIPPSVISVQPEKIPSGTLESSVSTPPPPQVYSQC